jgi:hypothetical protein
VVPEGASVFCWVLLRVLYCCLLLACLFFRLSGGAPVLMVGQSCSRRGGSSIQTQLNATWLRESPPTRRPISWHPRCSAPVGNHGSKQAADAHLVVRHALELVSGSRTRQTTVARTWLLVGSAAVSHLLTSTLLLCSSVLKRRKESCMDTP